MAVPVKLNPAVQSPYHKIFEMATLSPFTYEPLSDNAIRVLKLIGTASSGDPIYSLIHVELSQQPRFNALSYVWGSGLNARSINCDGKVLQTTEKSFEALAGLKSPIWTDGLPIWIDSICINQDDKTEKACQVTMMHQIYRRAETVIIWLGPEGDHSGPSDRIL